MRRPYAILLSSASLLLLAAGGCDKFASRVEVADSSFEVESTVYYSGDWQRKALGLKLASGEDGKVTVYYTIDGNDDLQLLNTSQKEFASGSTLDLSRKTSQTLLMPNLSNNRHYINLEYVKDGVSRTDTLSFTVSVPLYLNVNPSESLEYTRFSVTGQSGRTTLAFFIDGEAKERKDIKYVNPVSKTVTETGASFEVDFDKYQTWEFELPYLTPTDHTLTVTSTTANETVESYTSSFAEPTRKAIALRLEYDRASRALLATSTFNPAKVKFNVRVTATASGTLKYRPRRSVAGVADPETESVTGKTYQSDTTFCITPNDAALIVDGRVIAKAMENCHSNNRKDYYTYLFAGGKKTVYTQVNSVDVTIEIKSIENETPGETKVVIYPAASSGFTFKFYYTENTYDVKQGTVGTVKGNVKINGMTAWGSLLTL